MEQWALILADSVLLTVALGGGIVTLVRLRRLRAAAAVPAAIACGVLVVTMVFDMIWWTVVLDSAYNSEDFDRIQTYNNIGILVTTLLITTAVGLLLTAAHAGRAAAGRPVGHGGPQFGANGAAPAYPHPGLRRPSEGEAPAFDWNVHSGVWSMPPGTFDGPPPGQPPRQQ
jgi:hypothetical protein